MVLNETRIRAGEVRNDWGEVENGTTEIQTEVVVYAPNVVVGQVDNIGVDYTAEMNGVVMARAEKDGIRLDVSKTVFDVEARLDNSLIPRWWARHVNAGEESTLDIKPCVELDILDSLTAGVHVPKHRKTVETDILGCLNTDEPREKTVAGRTVFVIEDMSAEWGDATVEETPVDVTASVRNPNPFGVSFSRIDCDVRMNGVTVGGGETDDFGVAAGDEDEVSVDVSIDNDHLVDWWGTHVENNEQTQLEVIFYAVVGAFGREVRIPVFTFEDSIETDFLV